MERSLRAPILCSSILASTMARPWITLECWSLVLSGSRMPSTSMDSCYTSIQFRSISRLLKVREPLTTRLAIPQWTFRFLPARVDWGCPLIQWTVPRLLQQQPRQPFLILSHYPRGSVSTKSSIQVPLAPTWVYHHLLHKCLCNNSRLADSSISPTIWQRCIEPEDTPTLVRLGFLEWRFETLPVQENMAILTHDQWITAAWILSSILIVHTSSVTRRLLPWTTQESRCTIVRIVAIRTLLH